MTVESLALEVRWNATALATDGDMELAGVASFTATNCTLAKDAVTFFAGAQSLKGTNTAGSGSWKQTGSLAAGHVVTVTIRAKGGDAGTKLEVYTTPSNVLLASMSNPDTTNWNSLRVTGTIAVGDTGYEVRATNGTGAAIVTNWDNLEIEDWTDETPQLLVASWRRGRDYASQLTGRASTGTLNVQLLDPSGRYAPLNTAGPLYGKLVPGRKVRIRTTSPTAAILWQGFLDEIRPSPSTRDAAARAQLRASGPLKSIADKKASTAVFTSILTGAAVGKILDDAGWPASDRTIDLGQITMNRWKADGNSALAHLQELEEMELGYIGESKDGKIVWEDANHRVTLTTSQATFSDNNGAALSYEAIEELDPWRDVYNIATADVVLYTVQGLAVLWSMTGETPSINPGATKDFWAVYPTPDAATQADHVDAWTTPAITTDYLANTQADGLGTNKSAAVTVAVSKFANSMKISLTNTDAGVVYITLLQARGTAAYKNDPIRIVSEDATSQTTFGKKTYPLPGKFYPTTAIAKSYTDAIIARFKDQLAVVTFRYQANQSASHMTQALTRTVGERISIVANGTLASGAQLGIVQDFFIEAEEHSYDLASHYVNYKLSDARTISGYWLLGTNLLGTDTKLAL